MKNYLPKAIFVAGLVVVLSAPNAFAAPAYASDLEQILQNNAAASSIPLDVNRKRLSAYMARNDIPAAQRMFDTFAWRAFIALNWPANPKTGRADPGKTIGNGNLPLVWEYYRPETSIFLANGAKPVSWKEDLRQMTGKKTAPVHLLNESVQAFTAPLVDQNGKWVRYMVSVNQTEFDYIYKHELYSLDGQAAYTAHHIIDFPENTATQPGSIELKFSWKQLGPNDDPSRFIVRKARVVHMINGVLDPKNATVETMGLVGMHIAVRTQSSPTWIWATFEQVDDVAVDDMQKNSLGKRLHPLFNNPDAPAAPINVEPPKNALPGPDGKFTSWDERRTTTPVQVHMMLPIPKATEELNGIFRALLTKHHSVLRYYHLIGTQWPTQPSFPAFPGGTAFTGAAGTSAPESIIYKIPGKVVPVYLGNNTMETFFQGGNQKAGGLAEDERLPDNGTADPTIVFGTESCAGCHYSAGACIGFKHALDGKLMLDANGKRIPIFGKNSDFGQTGSAGFSWMLQMRAQAKPYKTLDN